MVCLAVVMSVMTSCTKEPNPTYTKLLEAEHFLNIVELDSAASRLDELKTMPLNDIQDSVLYTLVHSRYEKYRGHKLPDDEMPGIAAAYYSSINDNTHAMLAWYYQACVDFAQRRYSDAAINGTKMKYYAEQKDDHLYMARYADLMGHCAEAIGNNLTAARYYTYAYNEFTNYICEEPGYIDYFFTLSRNAWLKAGVIDSAIAISQKVKPYLLADGDSARVSKWLSNHATMLLNDKVRDYEGARALYAEMDSIGAPYKRYATSHKITKMLIHALADNDSAAWDEAMQMVEQSGGKNLSFGYFFHDPSATEIMVPRSNLNMDIEEILESMPEYKPDTEPAGDPIPDWVWICGLSLFGLIIFIICYISIYKRS